MKVVIIDDDQTYFDLVSEYLKYLGMDFYPKYLKEFESFRSEVRCIFSQRKSISEQSLESVINRINDFKNGSDDIVYVIDFSLDDSDPETNGVSLCEKILSHGFNEKVILVSKTSNLDDLEAINDFVINNSNCSFVSKNQKTFIQMLLQKIYTKTSLVV